VKKKIIIALSAVYLLFLFGGGYLIRLIDTNTSSFDEIIMFHNVEIMRESLLLNIRQVEADLYSQGTMHAESAESVENHVNDLTNAINVCFTCHHQEAVQQRLRDLQNQIEQYSRAANRGLSLKTKQAVLRTEIEKAHIIGDSLISKVNTMIAVTTKKLADRTANALKDAHRMRIILIMVIAAGPVLIAIVSLMVIKGVSKPVQALLDATRKLKSGNLDHRIEGLRDEFGELAIGFNAMAGSLKDQLRKIEESETRYRLLFESAGDAIFILDGESEHIGAIVTANQAAVSMHGFNREELLAMNIRDLDAPDAAAMVPGRFRRIFNGEWIKMQINHVRKDGTVFPVDVSAGLLEYGGHRYILAIDRDITERKKAEETLQRTEQLRCAGELATGLAHEIKNPLAGIKATIEILSGVSYLPDEDRGVLKLVIGEIKRIEVLIRDLLNFAKPSRPHFQDTDVNEVLSVVANLVLQNPTRSADASRAIEVEKHLDAGLPTITADTMQLKQVFMNLIMNAVDAMAEGGTLGMKTWYDALAKEVMVEISNTGKEIEASVMEKIFQPFFTTKPKGTGMGLAISKRLIENHSGSILIIRNINGGATFRISLPVLQREQVLL
jgi:two-component system, NtrC family, sensor histidine kinase AtoS